MGYFLKAVAEHQVTSKNRVDRQKYNFNLVNCVLDFWTDCGNLTDDDWLSDDRGAREGDLVGRGGERQAPAAAEAAERVRRLCQEVVREATPGEEPSVRFAGEWIFSFEVFLLK